MCFAKKVCYFAAGLGTGLAAGLLIAPAPGAETWSSVKKKACDGRDYLKRQGKDLQDAANAAVAAGASALKESAASPGTARVPVEPKNV